MAFFLYYNKMCVFCINYKLALVAYIIHTTVPPEYLCSLLQPRHNI